MSSNQGAPRVVTTLSSGSPGLCHFPYFKKQTNPKLMYRVKRDIMVKIPWYTVIISLSLVTPGSNNFLQSHAKGLKVQM